MTRGIVSNPARHASTVRAVLSALALVAIVVTIRILLAVVGGWPLATLGYHQAARTVSAPGPVDPHLVTAWLSGGALIVAWVSWVWMTVCVGLELRSWVTGRSPVRLPASRAVQSVAAFLVTTTLALSAVGSKESVARAPNASASAVVPPAAQLKVIDDWSLVGTTQHWDENAGRYTFVLEDAQTDPSRESVVLTADRVFEKTVGLGHDVRPSSPSTVADSGYDRYERSDRGITIPNHL